MYSFLICAAVIFFLSSAIILIHILITLEDYYGNYTRKYFFKKLSELVICGIFVISGTYLLHKSQSFPEEGEYLYNKTIKLQQEYESSKQKYESWLSEHPEFKKEFIEKL